MVADASDEVIYMGVDELLTEAVVEELRRTADRGLSIRLGGLSPTVHERIIEAVPQAEPFDSLWLWSDSPAGRLVMVDRQRTLVSVRPTDDDGERDETAIWGAGDSNSLVVVLRAIFTWQLDTLDER